MTANPTDVPGSSSRLSRDFWLLWVGQTISSIGSSFTLFALPLLTFKLTGSAISLSLNTAAGFLPYLLFGLVIGAWVDRVKRRQFMIATDLARALVVVSIPLLFSLHLLFVWWIYLVSFLATTLSIGFNASQFAAIPKLVNRDNLVTANGRLIASLSAGTIIGPLLAGLLVAFMPLANVLLFDALSFLISAFSLALIKTSFNASDAEKRPRTSIRQSVAEGLRYVIGHPVLRAIALMLALVNLVATTINAQLVFFAKHQLQASDTQIGLLYAVGSVGIVVLSLAAGPLRKRLSFSVVAMGALMLDGLLIVTMSLMQTYLPALLCWLLISGLSILFNINVGSLRQAIVPDHMLGRVMTSASVLAWSAIPIGTLLGGVAVNQVKNVGLVFAVIGVVTFLLACAFSFSPVGHADRYLPQKQPASTPQEGLAEQ